MIEIYYLMVRKYTFERLLFKTFIYHTHFIIKKNKNKKTTNKIKKTTTNIYFFLLYRYKFCIL
jgi:hypothetical protein